MSTYLERSTLRLERAAPRRPGRRHAGRRGAVLAAAWAQLQSRTLGGSFERLPDPARHPECWFRFL